MSDLGQVITFASRLYRQQAAVGYAGYLRRDRWRCSSCVLAG
jgi:hypothetical protein